MKAHKVICSKAAECLLWSGLEGFEQNCRHATSHDEQGDWCADHHGYRECLDRESKCIET